MDYSLVANAEEIVGGERCYHDVEHCGRSQEEVERELLGGSPTNSTSQHCQVFV